MRLRRLAAYLLSVLALTVGLAAAPQTTPPAEAAGNDYSVCNSEYSKGMIHVYNTEISPSQHFYVLPGRCTAVRNTSDGARIDPDDESINTSSQDVSRFRIGEIGGGYRDWVSGEGIINPPNAWCNCTGGGGVRVHTD